MRIRVLSKDTIYDFDADPGERILYAGLRAGKPLPYECASGTCGSCRARLSEGKIIGLWPEAPGQTSAHGTNEVLLCQVSSELDAHFSVDSFRHNPHPALVPNYVDGYIQELRYLTHDVIAIDIALRSTFNFAPGQFALLSLAGIKGWRAYSVVQGFGTALPSFIIKRKPGGTMCNWFFEECSAGVTVRLFGPLGSATFRPEVDKDILLLAGGSGLSMVLSILDAATTLGHTKYHRTDVVFGVRTQDDVFCLEQLSNFVNASAENVHITVALSNSSDLSELRRVYPSLRFESGFVHTVAENVIPAVRPATIGFIAGPPPMIDSCLRYLILKARLNVTNIRYDKFT